MSRLNTKQPTLIVTGMHRSGTSLTTSLLQSAGLHIGQRLQTPGPGSPKGLFENRDFLEFHQQVLYAQGVEEGGWTVRDDLLVPESYAARVAALLEDNASATQPWGWKDPRTSLFLEFWRSRLPDAKFLLVYRAPWEVIDSLYRRGDRIFSENPKFALDVWMHYNQKLLELYSHQPDRCVLAHINAITQNTAAWTQALRQKLGIPLGEPDLTIYDRKSLNRGASHLPGDFIIQRYFPEAIEVYKRLNDAADFADPKAWQVEGDRSDAATDWFLQGWAATRQLEQRNHKTQAELEALQIELKTLQQDHQHLQAQYEAARGCITAMETSKFWKLRTAWFRAKQLLGVRAETL